MMRTPRPTGPRYNQTQLADKRARLVNTMNHFTRAQSRGHRQPQCEPTGGIKGLWNYIQSGRLLPDLFQWGMHELKTNPFWRQQIDLNDVVSLLRSAPKGFVLFGNRLIRDPASFNDPVVQWLQDKSASLIHRTGDLIDYVRENPREVMAYLATTGASKLVEQAQWALEQVKAHPLESGLVVGSALVVIGAAVAVVASGGALLPIILAGGLTGAISGAMGQAIEDAARGQFSGWEAYIKQAAIGAAIGVVGGVVGMGASVLGMSPIVTGLVSGGVSGVFSQVMTNVWDGRPWHEGVGQAALTGGIGGMLGGAAMGALGPEANVLAKMGVSGGVGGGMSAASHVAMNVLAGRDPREGLGRAIAVGFATGAMDALVDTYGDEWQDQQTRRRRWDSDGLDFDQRARQITEDRDVRRAMALWGDPGASRLEIEWAARRLLEAGLQGPWQGGLPAPKPGSDAESQKNRVAYILGGGAEGAREDFSILSTLHPDIKNKMLDRVRMPADQVRQLSEHYEKVYVVDINPQNLDNLKSLLEHTGGVPNNVNILDAIDATKLGRKSGVDIFVVAPDGGWMWNLDRSGATLADTLNAVVGEGSNAFVVTEHPTTRLVRSLKKYGWQEKQIVDTVYELGSDIVPGVSIDSLHFRDLSDIGKPTNIPVYKVVLRN